MSERPESLLARQSRWLMPPLFNAAIGAMFAAAIALGYDAIWSLTLISREYEVLSDAEPLLHLNIVELAVATAGLLLATGAAVVGSLRARSPLTWRALFGGIVSFSVGALIAVTTIILLPRKIGLLPTAVQPQVIAVVGAVSVIAIVLRVAAELLPQRIVLRLPRRSAPALIIVGSLAAAAVVVATSAQSTAPVRAIHDPIVDSVVATVTSPLSDTTSQPTIPITGYIVTRDPVTQSDERLAAVSTVQLTVNLQHVATQSTDVSGDFTFPDVALRPGRNDIVVGVSGRIGWRSFTSTSPLTEFLIGSQLTTPVLDPVPSSVSTSAIVIAGTADPAVDVTIHVVRSRPDVSADTTIAPVSDIEHVHTDEVSGRFETTVQLGPHGRTVVTAFASSGDTHSKMSQPVAVSFDPTHIDDQAIDVRHLAMTASPTSLHTTIDVWLPRTDPRGVDLLEERLSIPDFFRQVFGQATLNGTDVAWMLTGATATIEVTGDRLHVQAQSRPEFEASVVTDSLRFNWGSSDYLSRAGDTFDLKVQDYEATSPLPEPAFYNGDEATWKGPVSSPNAQLSVAVRLDPVANPLSVMRLRPGDVVSWPRSTLLDLPYTVTGSLGLVWLLWLRARRTGEALFIDAFDRPLRALLRWVVAFSFLPAAIDIARFVALPADDGAASPFQHLVASPWHPLAQALSDPTRVSIAFLVLAAMMITVLALATRRFGRSGMGAALLE